MFNLLRQLQKEEIMAEDVVLWHNAKLELDKSTTNKIGIQMDWTLPSAKSHSRERDI